MMGVVAGVRRGHGGRVVFVATASALALVICGVAMPRVAAAQTAQSRIDVDIPAQDLNSALLLLTQRSGLQIAYEAEKVAGRSSSAVQGRFAPAEALSRMLVGTGLTFRFTGGNRVTLEPAPQAANGAIQLGPVRVEGESRGASTGAAYIAEETATSPVKGFVARRSATATKTDTPLIETPQSVSIVTADQIAATGVQSLADALSYVPGVARWEATNTRGDIVILRGFWAFKEWGNFYRDGMKYGISDYNGPEEPYGLERVEVLKGASSVLYGVSAPGGIINNVTKRPTVDPLRELNLSVGNFDRKQISGDFAGALSADGDWSYRLTFLARDSDTFVDHVPDNRIFIAPALKWEPDERTSLTLLSEYQHDRSNRISGFSEVGTILPNINGRIPRNRFMGEPGVSKYENDKFSVGYLFEHALSDRLQLRHGARLLHSLADRPFIEGWGLTPDQRSTDYRDIVYADEKSTSITTDTSLQYRWDTGIVEHTLLFGVDYTRQWHESIEHRATASSLDLFDPIYGVDIGVPEYTGTWRWRRERLGIYAQNQMKIDGRLVILVGGRQDWSKNYTKRASEAEGIWESTNGFTGRAGLVYLADSGFAPFLSFSQSFEPTAGLDRSGQRFKPGRGEQFEGGLRFQPENSNIMLSATAYQLTQTNVTVPDPIDNRYSVQMGKVQSRGVELEAHVSEGPLNITAAYTFTNARTIKSSPTTPEAEGRRQGAVPRNQFSLWSDYDLSGLGLSGLRLGGGVRYVGSTTGFPGSITGTVSAYTLLDAMVSYSTGPWVLKVNASNLTDKYYVSNCLWQCFYGEPRKIIATASYRW